jgi:hypothetical protein
MFVTRGLYEGETIIYPMIAGGNKGMVAWLLEKEKRMFEKSKSRCCPHLPFDRLLSVLVGEHPTLLPHVDRMLVKLRGIRVKACPQSRIWNITE